MPKYSPEIEAARRIAKEFGMPQVIVLMVDQDAGTIQAASHGRNGALCRDADRLAGVAMKAVQDHAGA